MRIAHTLSLLALAVSLAACGGSSESGSFFPNDNGDSQGEVDGGDNTGMALAAPAQKILKAPSLSACKIMAMQLSVLTSADLTTALAQFELWILTTKVRI